jgi:uncharacterized protein
VVRPVRYAVEVTHRRRDPVAYGFRASSTTWLVDLDDVPLLPRRLRWVAGFHASDHLGDRGAGLRQNLDAFLAAGGVERPERILMLASPRVLGYVFNPLSVFYCLDAQGIASHAVAEVRNTYGGRHSYLLALDPRGAGEVEKAFYVSPFYGVDGSYTMRLPFPGDEVLVSVTLHREGERPFVAVLSGRRMRGSSLWSALRTPLATRAVMAGIRRHGLTLYLKGLRPQPRPPTPQEKVS